MLSVKEPTQEGQKIIQKMEGRVFRITYLTDSEIQKFKLKSVTTNSTNRDLLDKCLNEVMNDNNIQFKRIKVDAKKRSFEINQTRLKEMKIFLIGQESITQDILIYNAVLRAIS
ncbi:hypothetical protein [uncultured Gammaproteobacteria bacterium]|jgi:hypothetical protein|uniref:Uncharacterized protein n=1 Tax=Bathymodiolus azoricus thioautotrophic gill symbiont TaxID=235205 RepID=A0ACA8ZNF2_9GAMM|nr:hypothetical protein [Bathymodiolus azoricus thioautotrophic gill symbiont]CAB5496605.1 hypothetical protein AZO1586R_462 [Bathymodiolus azoricus thioautotrophic gill symbiont]CAC9492084.1 hypothetical protein [uncultured Gammaproteobacteria bacterium]CAC9513834.1 hypothetical protein [uncultured Gammaproteobacteria bacterium]